MKSLHIALPVLDNIFPLMPVKVNTLAKLLVGEPHLVQPHSCSFCANLHPPLLVHPTNEFSQRQVWCSLHESFSPHILPGFKLELLVAHQGSPLGMPPSLRLQLLSQRFIVDIVYADNLSKKVNIDRLGPPSDHLLTAT